MQICAVAPCLVKGIRRDEVVRLHRDFPECPTLQDTQLRPEVELCLGFRGPQTAWLIEGRRRPRERKRKGFSEGSGFLWPRGHSKQYRPESEEQFHGDDYTRDPRDSPTRQEPGGFESLENHLANGEDTI